MGVNGVPKARLLLCHASGLSVIVCRSWKCLIDRSNQRGRPQVRPAAVYRRPQDDQSAAGTFVLLPFCTEHLPLTYPTSSYSAAALSYCFCVARVELFFAFATLVWLFLLVLSSRCSAPRFTGNRLAQILQPSIAQDTLMGTRLGFLDPARLSRRNTWKPRFSSPIY